MSCSMMGNDVFVYNILNKAPGYFLDIGCGEGSCASWSNSIYLEERGWRGIGVDIAGINTFKTLRKSVGVEADLTQRHIEDILDENNAPEVIDFFSFDVDQAQKFTLDNLKLNKYVFKHIHFEHNVFITPDDPNYVNLYVEYMKPAGYKKFTNAGYIRIVENVLDRRNLAIEDWYVHKDYLPNNVKYLKDILYTNILKEYNFID